jgi:hypothetical protein
MLPEPILEMRREMTDKVIAELRPFIALISAEDRRAIVEARDAHSVLAGLDCRPGVVNKAWVDLEACITDRLPKIFPDETMRSRYTPTVLISAVYMKLSK